MPRKIRQLIADLEQAGFHLVDGGKGFTATYLKWEHGERRPSGPGRALLRIAAARPEVIHGLLGIG